MTPIEALEKAIEWALVWSGQRRPGAVVSSQSAETRDALSRLTSDDAANTRYPKP